MKPLWNRLQEEAGADGATDGMAAGVGDQPGETGDGGSGESDWRSVLPEGYRDMGIVQNAKDMDAFMQRVKENDSYRGGSVRLPTENLSDEQRAEARDKILKHFEKEVMLKPDFENEEQSRAFYQTMGMPGEPSGYHMPEVEGIQMPEDAEAAYRQIAHEVGLTDKQFNALMSKGMGLDVQRLEAHQKQVAEGLAGLKADWGAEFNEKSEAVKKFVKERLPSLDADVLPPQAMREIWDIAREAYKGDPQLDKSRQIFDVPDRQEALEQIGELRNNKEFMEAYNTPSHPGNAAAKAKMRRLYQIGYPEDENQTPAYQSFGIG